MLNEKSKSNIVKTLFIVCFIAAFIVMTFNWLGSRSNKSGIGIYNMKQDWRREQNSNRLLEISKQLTTELETVRQQLKISEQASTEAKL